ncbi:MAG TPA: Glu-tRNA(Gln) amidotransferase subunit GatD [Candidatus Bathyarchaeia archaeon]|nr:Glu-tRNA(Gln) amidotransferase subunit GatD [Candidatus Bathyarchaeia archaeon]
MPDDPLYGYFGLSRELLTKAGAKIGDRISVRRKTGDMQETIDGLLMPRLQTGHESDFLVVKLRTGYNIGIQIDKTTQVNVIGEGAEPRFTRPPLPSQMDGLPKVSIISTGGTIASKVDYRTGAVKPALDAEDIYSVVPELANIANVDAKVLSNIFSENIGPQQWSSIASSISEQINHGAQGVVIAHGTDTLAYTAAALSFALNTPPVPVIVVGSQRSSDRPSSDAAANLTAATAIAAKAPFAEVGVAMHDWISDQKIAIHRATKVRKCHTSRRDAFESINSTPLAYYDLITNSIETNSDNLEKRRTIQGWSIKPKFDPNVVLIKFYPGISVGIIDWAIASGYKGIVLEGSGLGHVGDAMFPAIERALNEGIIVAMCSQCIWGRVHMNVYSTGRDLLRLGVIPLDDMLSETALVKMMWAFANERDIEAVKKIMVTSLHEELSDRRTIEADRHE